MPAASKKRSKRQSFGSRMKKLRNVLNSSMEKVADDTGCTIERLERIENDEVLPTVSEVIRISKSLSVDPGAFLSAEEEQEAKKRKLESFRKRTEAYSYTPLTPDAQGKHMKAFQINIDPLSDHKMVEYRHAGEEFIYVLRGILEIRLGDNRKNLSPGESIHFDSSIRHALRNVSDEAMELIVVVYTP